MKKGEIVTCYSPSRGGSPHLTRGKNYVVKEDREPGIFPGKDNEYVTVYGDNNKTVRCYAWRFEKR